MLYADTSALAKLVLPEHESDALSAYLGELPALASSVLALTELPRAVRRTHPALEAQVAALLANTILIDLNRDVVMLAGTVAPSALRTLDAIHLATALTLGDELEALLTYDARMASAAREAGIEVVAPA